MDSCNSGDVDLVSSSAEEDYEDSSFASSTPTQSPLPSLPPGLFHSSLSSFDSLSSYPQLDSFSSPHLDSVWSRKRPASSLLSPSPPVLGGATIPYPGDSGAVFPGSGDGLQPAPAATKSGKKRSRASRRAPTTVLTTDTTNFRQMVQEFTGIPTPPFGSTSAFSRDPRLDLLGGSGSVPPPFLLRSNFQQKNSPILSHLANNINTNNNGNNISTLDISPTNNTTNSFGPAESPAPELLFQSGYQAHSTFPNSLFNVQSLMNSSSKFQFPSFVPGKPPAPDLPLLPDSIPPMNVSARILNEHGNNPCHVGLNRQDNAGAHINNTINISGTSTPSVNPARSLLAEGIGVMVDKDEVGIRPQPSTTGGNRSNPQQSFGGTICEMNYDTPPTKFHVEKGPEAVSRAENTVESWICSSDLPTTEIPGTQLRPRT